MLLYCGGAKDMRDEVVGAEETPRSHTYVFRKSNQRVRPSAYSAVWGEVCNYYGVAEYARLAEMVQALDS